MSRQGFKEIRVAGRLILQYRYAKGNFSYKTPLYLGSNPETIYIDNSADITLGKGVSFSRCVSIYTHEHDHSRDILIGNAGVELIPLEIGDDVFISANVIICPKVRKIGTGAVIGAGAVVTKDIGENEIWCGNPAKFRKFRT